MISLGAIDFEHLLATVLFIIDLFTGRKASIYKRGYRDIYNRRGSGRRRLFRIEVGAVLRKKIAYDFLYFLFSPCLLLYHIFILV